MCLMASAAALVPPVVYKEHSLPTVILLLILAVMDLLQDLICTVVLITVMLILEDLPYLTDIQ